MKIVIPMAGRGKRFLKAGYAVPKPLIVVDGLPMVEHIVRNFSPEDDFVFGVNEEHVRSFPLEALLKKIAPRSVTVSMPYQEEGPIPVIENLFPRIGDDEPAVVNYCDFSWAWDYADFKRRVVESGCDGAVVCYRGFHPHLLGPNLYATLDADGVWMKAILEKHTWHGDKTKDWTSSGTYYFRKGSALKKYFRAIQNRPELKIRGEHYVSQVFGLMKEDGLKILIYEIPVMLQWGTPEDLEEYLYWSDYFRKKTAHDADRTSREMAVMILMAGAGLRFAEADYQVPKPFIPVDGEPMAVRSARCLPLGSRYWFVTRAGLSDAGGEERIRSAFPSCEIVRIQDMTEGQASTALAAAGDMDPDEPLLIGACDHAMVFDRDEFRRLTSDRAAGADALIFTYRNNPAVRRKPEMYGWVDADEQNRVRRVSVKVPLEGDPAGHHAVIGAFWFKRAKFFTDNAETMIRQNRRIRGEFYIDECMNFLIAAGLRVDVFEVQRYVSWGTPDDLACYEYWQRFFAQAYFHPYQPGKVPA